MAVCVCVFGLNQNEYKIKQFYELLSMEMMSYNIFDSLLKSSEMGLSHLYQRPWIWDTALDHLTSLERPINIGCIQLLCINSSFVHTVTAVCDFNFLCRIYHIHLSLFLQLQQLLKATCLSISS